jgi:hypothetical protein
VYKLQNSKFSRVRKYTSIIPSFGRLRQKDCELKASLGHTVRLSKTKQNKTTIKNQTKNLKKLEILPNTFKESK